MRMFKAFCDGCGEECDPANTGSRRFPILLKNRVGLEAIPLYESKPSPEHHLCDGCIASLLLRAAENFVNTDQITRHFAKYEAAETWFSRKHQIEKKEAEIEQKQTDLDVLTKQAKKELADLEQMRKEEVIEKKNEEIKVLKASIEALKQAATAQQKIELAQKIQTEIDERENSDYIRGVQRRERMRIN